MAKLSLNEAKALSAWREIEIGYGFGFKVVAKKSGLDGKLVRRAVRALARKGMVEFERALWSEFDGSMQGAGYTLTIAGRDYLDGSGNAGRAALAEDGQ